MSKTMDKYIKAEELVNRLNNENHYQKLMDEKKKRRSRQADIIKEIERPILRDLESIGIKVLSISELIKIHAPLSNQIIKILLFWLPRVDHFRVQDMIVRALGSPAEPYNGRPLAVLFDTTKSKYDLRWVIADTIDSAQPTGINDWVVETVQNPSYGNSRQMLCYALVKMVPADKAIPILKSIFDQFPVHAASALGQVGDMEISNFLKYKRKELENMKDQNNIKNGYRKNMLDLALKNIDKSIYKIEKRDKER